MEEAFAALLAQSGLCAEAFYKVCSIDLKRDEPGLRAFCAAHGFASVSYTHLDVYKRQVYRPCQAGIGGRL